MMNEPNQVTGGIVTVLGFVGAVTLHEVSIAVAILSGLVSIVVGVLTIRVLLRKLKQKGNE